MGFIIFLITIAISLFSAIGDKQHEKRQKQQPPRPQKPTETPEKGFFEKVQETLSEMEKSLSEPEKMASDKPQKTKESVSPVDYTKKVDQQVQPQQTSERRNDEEQERQRLNDMVSQRMHELGTELHLERQKQLASIEKRAKAIIEDPYMSNRAKQVKLKTLTDATNIKASATQGMSFSNNEVINGIIWSEILNKPKQL
ncbi:hypothetical protein [Staphylococcus americanisciuri]|nr:hypothetical protein [Staphylococcus americanisciuri]